VERGYFASGPLIDVHGGKEEVNPIKTGCVRKG
jgi:hypothetical protein